MDDLLHSLSDRLELQRSEIRSRAARMSHPCDCRCGHSLFFDDLLCPSCNAALGYLPDEGRIAALEPGPRPETWLAPGRADIIKFCANRHSPAGCNWMIYADRPVQFCIACRLNRAIPSLDDPDNIEYWGKIEAAKRRLISELLGLSLPVRSKLYDDPDRGLMFDFLRSSPGGPQVMTGHANGLITLNVEEADDAKREHIRHAMHEPYRALLGHFRHEVGHYYWDRLVWDSQWLEPFRQLFGDERASYAEALKRHYEQGPPAHWQLSHISSYATMHPWEDWAETWAHYLHAVGTLSTIISFGVEAEDIKGKTPDFGKDALYAPDDPMADLFLEILNGWLEIITVINILARNMGQPDFYPFTLSKPAVAKLQFVQIVVANSRTRTDL
jgi:hypothetical protein